MRFAFRGFAVAVIENSVLIRRPIEEVFEYLTDLRNELSWNPQCRSMEKVGDGPVGLGTTFRAKWKQSPLIEVVCTAFDRPRSWQYTNGGPIAVVLESDQLGQQAVWMAACWLFDEFGQERTQFGGGSVTEL